MTTMYSRLMHLKQRGFNPSCILDIGAYRGEWADMARTIFPGSKLYLFEADEHNALFLKQKGYDYTISLLGNETKENVAFYRCPTAAYQTGNSIFKEKTKHYTGDSLEIKLVNMKTLDEVLAEKSITRAEFIKLDVQGAELLVLEGAKNILSTTEAILLEVAILEYNEGAPKINEIIRYMDSIGFETYDIIEMHYLPNQLLCQVDIVFLRKTSELMPAGLLC